MEMRNIIVTSGRAPVFKGLLRTADNSLADFLLLDRFPRAHIPDYDAYEAEGRKPVVQYVVKHLQGQDKIKVSHGNCTIFSEKPNHEEFAYVLLALFEAVRNSEGQYTLHASAMAKDGKGVMFLGARGSGKSTMCQELIAREWDYVSDEHTVLQGRNIIGGCTVSVPREGEVISVQGLRSLEVALVVTPKLSERDVLLEDRWGEWLASLKLYEEASEIIRGIGIRLGSAPLMPLDTERGAASRLEWAKEFTSSVPFVFAEGNKRAIGDHIEALLRR
jgi:energy-coupling factor transporter ATP-binding protein EcfA2